MIIEIIIILFLLNLLFALTYYKTYLDNKNSFKNIHDTKPLTLFDFFYFSCTTFFLFNQYYQEQYVLFN